MSGVYPSGVEVRRHARISTCGQYRYALWREWRTPLDPSRWVTFVMLNPSTADATIDDPTIRRCVGFARALGGTGLAVANLYAYRATKPADLWHAADPVGPENADTLAMFLDTSARHGFPVIAAWGSNAKPDRVQSVLSLPGAERLTTLGTTKQGAPRHPLYVRGDQPLIPYDERSVAR